MTQLVELYGIYNANSTFLGEVSYWFGALLDVRHCSLCAITHGLFLEKETWKESKKSIPIPFGLYHRNDYPKELSAIEKLTFPCVIAKTSDDTFVMLIDDVALLACKAEPELLRDAIDVSMKEHGYTFPS